MPVGVEDAGDPRPRLSFKGETHHTAHWPHEGVDFTGKRVGVIGTGSSAVQSIPVIAAQAVDLTVFQRTPAYSLPARNRALTVDEIVEMKANYRAWRQAQKESGFGVPVTMPTKSALEVSDDERDATFEQAWESGSLVNLLTAYTDLATNQDANDTAKRWIHNKITTIVTDPRTAQDLCPEYPVGTKRPCLDTNYYETYNRENVHLVNLQRKPLVEVTDRGVRTAGREYEFDAIVYATGFDAMTGSLTNVDIRGRDGLSLKETWSAGPRTYLGIGSAGFPNLFMITGPGSPSVLSNMVVSIEQHVDWVCDAVAHLRAEGLTTIEATQEAQDAWVDHVNLVASYTLYPKANSWYMGANVPESRASSCPTREASGSTGRGATRSRRTVTTGSCSPRELWRRAPVRLVRTTGWSRGATATPRRRRGTRRRSAGTARPHGRARPPRAVPGSRDTR